MKTLGLYQIFDNVGKSAITQIIPAATNLTAALGFRNAYIQEKDPRKNPYQYKALDLIKVANVELNEDGLVSKVTAADWTIQGSEVMNFIQEEMQALGVDDFILDDETEEKTE